MRTPERLLDGRYRTIRRLGSGGMATVFLAMDERLGRLVAIKRLHGDVSDDDLVRRFRREARVGASLNHPNVVAVYDIGGDDEGVLIVMEYVEGHTLRDEIARGPMPPERALPILRGVAEALDHVHDLGVVHRDVKPANVLLRDDGAVKLADLGIATAAEQTRITRSGAVLGTAAYMAPERLDGEAGDRRVDVWALASVAFEALAGRKAVEGVTPVEVARRVVSQPPPDLRAALPSAPAAAADPLRRGLAKDPTDRQGSAGELVSELVRGFSAAPPTPATAATPPTAQTAATPPTAQTAAIKGETEATVLDRGRIGTQSQRGGGDRPRPDRPSLLPFDRARRRRLAFLTALAALAAVGLIVALSSGGGGSKEAAKPAAAKKKRAAGSSTPAAPAPSAPAPATTPEGTVNDFYQRAARHDYAGAWRLLTPGAQGQLGGLASFSRGQATLRSISFPVLNRASQTTDAATVDIESNAVHATRTDHVCGTVDLVRSGSAWLIDAFHLDTCPGASAPAAAAPGKRGKRRGQVGKHAKPSRAHGQAGAEGGD